MDYFSNFMLRLLAALSATLELVGALFLGNQTLIHSSLDCNDLNSSIMSTFVISEAVLEVHGNQNWCS